jgi:hypothetical protein
MNELEIMAKVFELLKDLTPPTQHRILQWAGHKLTELREEKKETQC